jgi:hypothetical protein
MNLKYYDIQINNFQSTNNQSQHLIFNETRNSPIITNAQDYELSIVRFQLDTYSLPTFIADLYINETHKMIESMTLEYTNNQTVSMVGPLHLEWTPTNVHLQPSDPEYYYGNSYQHYVNLCNTCLKTLTNTLKTNLSKSDIIAPYIIWNSSTQSIEIITQDKYFNESNTEKIAIYFNRPLYAKFTSLPAIKDYRNITSGKIYKISIVNNQLTNNFLTDVGEEMIRTNQEYSTISNWSPISSIVFISNTLPIIATEMSAPVVYSNGIQIKTPQFNSIQGRIISDMATNELGYKPDLLYSPTGEYRMISMTRQEEIKTLDISVFWKSKQGNLIPFILQSGASASIKIMFRKIN